MHLNQILQFQECFNSICVVCFTNSDFFAAFSRRLVGFSSKPWHFRQMLQTYEIYDNVAFLATVSIAAAPRSQISTDWHRFGGSGHGLTQRIGAVSDAICIHVQRMITTCACVSSCAYTPPHSNESTSTRDIARM